MQAYIQLDPVISPLSSQWLACRPLTWVTGFQGVSTLVLIQRAVRGHLVVGVASELGCQAVA